MSMMPAGYADAVVWPESTEEVSAVVKYAYENNIPVVPVSSQTHMYGSTIPKQGGIVIDMKNMNKILEIDLKHKFVRFQPGVTWNQMYEELDKVGRKNYDAVHSAWQQIRSFRYTRSLRDHKYRI